MACTNEAGQPLGGYRRRAPERTVLHELVAGHAQTLIAELREADPDGGGLPRYVERELAAYLRCGILARGFTRVRCQFQRRRPRPEVILLMPPPV